MAVNPRAQACVVLLVQQRTSKRLGTRERLFRNGYTVMVAGTLLGTRDLLAGIMPAMAAVDLGTNIDRAVELKAQLADDPRFQGVPVMLEIDLSE